MEKNVFFILNEQKITITHPPLVLRTFIYSCNLPPPSQKINLHITKKMEEKEDDKLKEEEKGGGANLADVISVFVFAKLVSWLLLPLA